MRTLPPTSASKTFDQQLKNYARLSQAVLLSPLKNPKSLLPLGAAFLSGLPAADAAIVYSGVQNIGANIPVNFNSVRINLNGAGGNDFEIQDNEVAGVKFIQVNEVGSADLVINAFIANIAGNYGYPLANNSGFVIGPAGPWNFGVGDANSLADDSPNENQYPGTKWETDGMTKFIGFRGTLGGGTKYGWIRLTRNTHTNWTLVDWAYQDVNNTSIVAGMTVLPIQLVKFEAYANAQTAHLDWRTASEQNNAGFDLERSEDGQNFRSIAWLEGKGTTAEEQQYLYDDKNLREGKTYYYRLRQVDYNGKFEFSPVVTIMIEGKGTIVGEFYPNPAPAGLVRLDFMAKADGDWTISVLDAAGKLVNLQKQTHFSVAKGEVSIPFDFSGLSTGIYFVKMENGTERVYRKLVIE